MIFPALEIDWSTGLIAKAIAERIRDEFDVEVIDAGRRILEGKWDGSEARDGDLIWAKQGVVLDGLDPEEQERSVIHVGSVRSLDKYGMCGARERCLGITCGSRELIERVR